MTRYVFDFSRRKRRPEGPAGRQGRQPRRDDQPRASCPARFHDHDRRLPRLPRDGHRARELAGEVDEHLAALEKKMGRTLGQADDPLLVSVRSGAKFSMPGMMETVLNVGLNDESVEGLAQDLRQRAVRVGLLPTAALDVRRHRARRRARRRSTRRSTTSRTQRGVETDVELDGDDFEGLVSTYKKIITDADRLRLPAGPREQLDLATVAVFSSWNTDRAKIYRRQERIPDDLGTAVNICSMVFGNLGDDSGTGVCFTRDPAIGSPRRVRRLPAERPGRGRGRGHPQHACR